MADPKIQLIDYHYEEQGQPAGASLSVQLDEQHNLRFSGADFGPTAESMLGDWDYEYWLTIDTKDQDQLLLALLRERFTNPGVSESINRFSGISAFKQWLDQQGIKYQYQSY